MKRALYSMKRALYPLKRALYPLKRALLCVVHRNWALHAHREVCFINTALHSMKRALYSVEGHATESIAISL